MKTRQYPILAAALFAAAACQKSIEAGLPSVWFTGTEDLAEVSLYVDGPTSASFSVTASAVSSEDISVEVAIDADQVAAYNEKNGTDYKMLPAGSYKLSDTSTTILAHKNVSAPLSLDVLSMDDFEEGITYCVPVRLSNVSGGYSVLRTSEYMYLVLKGIIHTTGSDFNSTGYYSVPTMLNSAALSDLDACTMEIRVKMDAFYPESANPGIASLIGVEEMFLLRFGDISCKKNQLQLAGRGVSITSKTFFETGRWYHIAVVDDRNTARLYVDGELDTEVSSAGKAAIDLGNAWMDGFHIGFSERGRLMDGTVSEARVWNRALSPVELTNNQCVITDPASAAKNDKLIAYWRLDEENKGNDLSGNGYDAVPTSVTFVEGVDCPVVGD